MTMAVKTPKKLKKSVRLTKGGTKKKKPSKDKLGDNPIRKASLAQANKAVDTEVINGNRWYELKPHKVRLAFYHTLLSGFKRFVVCPSGRRSGKTEYAKRAIVSKALECLYPDGRFVCAAPTREQAKDIYWEDMKTLVPKACIAHISETKLCITLVHGPKIFIMGMDKPERVEGTPLDGIILDEFGNMKKNVWKDHVRPALATIGRPGFAWFIGVPEGRNHYYDLVKRAQGKRQKNWGYYQWSAEDILDEEEIEDLRDDLDELTYNQEIKGLFINFQGRAYYNFDQEVHAIETVEYDPTKDLIFAFDFNIAPGVCAVMQEQIYHGDNPNISRRFTACIGEVYIPRNSNTLRVCDRLILDWKHHTGNVFLYGDSTGGNQGTAKVSGSDWDLIRKKLKPVFRDRLKFRVPSKNGPERVRVNAMNSRIKTINGQIRFLVDPDNAPNVCKDFEGVSVLEGGSGEIDKKSDLALTHISDAIGYYIVEKFPLEEGGLAITDI